MNHPFTNPLSGVCFTAQSRHVFAADAPVVVGEPGAQALARELGCTVVVFGAAYPLISDLLGD
jgi:hypothetical protein